jgi:hypothetical protein
MTAAFIEARNQLARESADVRDELDTANRRIAELSDDLGDRTAERDHLSAWASWLWQHATPVQQQVARGALGHLPDVLDDPHGTELAQAAEEVRRG